MFTALDHFVYRFRWMVLVISIAMLVASGYVASRGGKLESGGSTHTAESGRASKRPSASSRAHVLFPQQNALLS